MKFSDGRGRNQLIVVIEITEDVDTAIAPMLLAHGLDSLFKGGRALPPAMGAATLEHPAETQLAIAKSAVEENAFLRRIIAA